MRLKLMTLAFGFCLVLALPLAAKAGPTPGGTDTDGDGVEDAFDNCTTRSNATQGDVDHDGCGDFCDFDWNNDGLVKPGEVALAASQAGSPTCATTHCQCDFNFDGACKPGEVASIAAKAGQKPGPSGITTAQCKTARCQCTPAP